MYLRGLLVCTGLLACSAGASALEFRGTALGDSCQQASQRELSLGSHPLHAPGLMLKSGTLIFEGGKSADPRPRYTYTCTRAGTVTLYSIALITRREARARDALAKARVAATKRLGKPADDSEFPEATEKLHQLRLKGLTATYAFVDWKAADHQAVNLTLEKPEGSSEWTVTTTVAPDTETK